MIFIVAATGAGATLKAMVVAARAENDRLDAERQCLANDTRVLAAEVDRLMARNEHLEHIVSVLRRAQFVRRSEKIDADRIELVLEDIETQHGTEDAALPRRPSPSSRSSARGAGAPIAVTC